MFDKNEDLVFITFQLITPSLKGLDNSKKLFIVSFILGFNYNHLSREKSYQMLLPNFGIKVIQVCISHVPRSYITKDFTNSKAKYINFNPNIMFQNKIIRNWSFNQCYSSFDDKNCILDRLILDKFSPIFLLLISLPSSTLLLPISLDLLTLLRLKGLRVVLNIEVSRIAILLKF